MERQESRRKLKCAIFGNPGTFRPCELHDIVFGGNLENIIIRKKGSLSVVIPGETLEEIRSIKNEKLKAIFMTRIFTAIQIATALKLNYKIDDSAISSDNFTKPEVF